ncbi:MAG: creatininase family protein [Gemmatimonadetes bacterium]|nr:creatininase family protein [Gemmatimonadota bacterium]
MPVSYLADLTWEEVRDFDLGKAVAILPVGAVEAHGPHLPLTTDVIISEAMARSAAEKLEAQGYPVLILPSISYTAAPFAASFPGTCSLDADAATAVLVSIARNLTRQGVRILAVANSHLDPANIAAIEAAVASARQEKLLKIVFPDISKKPWAMRLTDEFKSGACHAGQYETSVVLAERPELVRENIRKELAPNPSSLSDAIRAGLETFEEADGARAYFGCPADASIEEGKQTVDILGSILEEAVREHGA